MQITLKPLVWVGSSLEALKCFPKIVQREIGFTLYRIQQGITPINTKFLKGFDSGVMEIISDYNKNTYRAIYVCKWDNCIYVLHAFQKKSKTGIQTPKQEINLIKKRLQKVKESTLS